MRIEDTDKESAPTQRGGLEDEIPCGLGWLGLRVIGDGAGVAAEQTRVERHREIAWPWVKRGAGVTLSPVTAEELPARRERARMN